TWSQEAGGRAVWIDEIYVLPEFQGRGMAKAFFAELKEIAPAARYRLEIEPDNARAEKLYRGVGFEELGYRQLVMDLPQ
ncbi:MAG: GNAT family N-acetyltransferase, partial [Clostridia bacterium]|nr:GNAT family N-acetyltransferase [Clostridia bacterium]